MIKVIDSDTGQVYIVASLRIGRMTTQVWEDCNGRIIFSGYNRDVGRWGRYQGKTVASLVCGNLIDERTLIGLHAGTQLRFFGGEPNLQCRCWPPPCRSMVERYGIVGYSDDFFSLCWACASSSDPAWDGSFIAAGADLEWDATCCTWLSPDGPLSIHAKKLSQGYTYVEWDGYGYWRAQIVCIRSGPVGGTLIWEGTKIGGNSPAGTFTRTQGCDTHPSITLAPLDPVPTTTSTPAPDAREYFVEDLGNGVVRVKAEEL